MANPRTSSDLWDASGDEDFRPYPNATPRRVAFAHALGVVGVLGTIGLAVAAFVPRMPSVMDRVHAIFGRTETEAQTPTTPPESARDVVSPKLEVVPQFTAASPVEPPAATVVSPVARTEPPSVAVAVPPAVVATEPPPATTPPATTPPAAADTAAVTGRALANGKASAPDVAPAPAAPPATASVAPPATTASVASEKAATRVHSPVAMKKTARSEPPLTPHEIERRQQRYELWLKQQGLERVH